jgi:hypothetical protein
MLSIESSKVLYCVSFFASNSFECGNTVVVLWFAWYSKENNIRTDHQPVSCIYVIVIVIYFIHLDAHVA